MKLRFLDLYCCAGGAAMGMHRAYPNAEIIGVDNKPQRHYPFLFVQADALNPPFDLSQFDFIWASPPCQRYSNMQHIHKNKNKWPDLVEPTRKQLIATGKPFVIENVVGAPLRIDLLLCGTMFGLRIIRHRIFESNMPMPLLTPVCNHSDVYDPWHEDGNDQRNKLSKAMSINWFMNRQEIREAIPPDYSEYILRQIKL